MARLPRVRLSDLDFTATSLLNFNLPQLSNKLLSNDVINVIASVVNQMDVYLLLSIICISIP